MLRLTVHSNRTHIDIKVKLYRARTQRTGLAPWNLANMGHVYATKYAKIGESIQRECIMKLTYSGADKYGSYDLRYDKGILYAVVKGAIGLSLAKKFHLDLQDVFAKTKQQPWAYVGDLSACHAYTEEVEALLPTVHLQAIEAGCVVDAYIFGTAVLKAQIDKIRTKAGAQLELRHCTFDTVEHCEKYVANVLNHRKSH